MKVTIRRTAADLHGTAKSWCEIDAQSSLFASGYNEYGCKT
jgi:hypothetical protein